MVGNDNSASLDFRRILGQRACSVLLFDDLHILLPLAVGRLIQLLARLWRLPERPSLVALPAPSILGNPVDISTETPRYLAAREEEVYSIE